MKIINQNKECELSSISIFSHACHFQFTPACRRERRLQHLAIFTIRHVLNLQEPDSPIVDYLNKKLLRRFLMDHLSFINCQCHFKIMYQVPPHQRPLNRHLTVIDSNHVTSTLNLRSNYHHACVYVTINNHRKCYE